MKSSKLFLSNISKVFLSCTLLLSFTALSSSFAGELDNESSNTNISQAQELPQMVIVKVDKEGNTSMISSKDLLEENDVVKNFIAQSSFKTISVSQKISKEVASQMSELDFEEGAASWYFVYAGLWLGYNYLYYRNYNYAYAGYPYYNACYYGYCGYRPYTYYNWGGYSYYWYRYW